MWAFARGGRTKAGPKNLRIRIFLRNFVVVYGGQARTDPHAEG